MRLVFLGTPDFAVPALRALLDAHDVACVYTQPDRPRGRGLEPLPTPVKRIALEAGVDTTRNSGRLRPRLTDEDRLRRIGRPMMLGEGGLLYVGHSESLFRVCDRFTAAGRTIYRKIA